jgi:hypothetical protein
MSSVKLPQLILLLITLIVGIYIVASVEFYEETREVGASKEVRQQPYLASKFLLEKFAVTTTIEDDYRRLFSNSQDALTPQLDDAIVLVDANAAISEHLSDELLTWVKKGGFLITAVNAYPFQESFRANSFLEKLGVTVNWLVKDEKTLNDYKQQDSTLYDPNDHKVEIGLESSYRILLPDDTEVYYAVENEEGPTLIQIELGEGMITLMTETFVWNNEQITQHDNAVLLVSFLENMTHVYIISPKEQDHWFLLLYRYSAEFVWLLALLVIMSLWHFSSRFGPIRNLIDVTQSHFSQHIKVAGDHYWDNGKQHLMLAELRSLILLKLGQRWPAIRGADQQKMILLLQELSGWPPETIKKLMFEDTTLNQSQFTQWMKGLQQLRKML